MVRKKKSSQEISAITEPIAVDDTMAMDNLRANLEEINKYDGVIGYILRNSTSASIDLKDPTRIIDYAILSSSALEAGEELSKLFNLGEVKDVIISGNDTKVLSLTVGENRVSVFLEKDADFEKVLKKLR